jgi:hypothetical protein
LSPDVAIGAVIGLDSFVGWACIDCNTLAEITTVYADASITKIGITTTDRVRFIAFRCIKNSRLLLANPKFKDYRPMDIKQIVQY